jgi:hypothetical protein
MKTRSLLKIAIIFIVAVCVAGIGGLYAGKTVQDVIKMENKAYAKHKKSILEFSHKKHVEEYKAGCGECHHDENNKPLDNLKEGDDVQNCIECHSKPSMKPKGKGAKKLTKKEALEYHAEAIHQNCKGCHKDFNKKNKADKKKSAPTKCKECHPKKKK